MIRFETRGDFKKSTRWLSKLQRAEFYEKVNAIAAQGTSALASATPVDSSKTAASWTHQVTISRGGCKVEWLNSNVNAGVPIAIILQYGHGTGTGGYVAGRDYINPAMTPIFEKIANEVWNEVTRIG